MNELKSYTEYAVSTPTADFVIGFDFNYGEDAVNVTVDNVPATEAGYTVVYLNETTIQLSPSVSSGVVRLQRETDIDQSDHAYRAGAKFIAQTMDENFEQLRHSQQEVRDGFSKLKGDTYALINGLDEALELAQDAAQDAQDAAVIAQDAADTVNAIIIGGKVAADKVLDSSGETQQAITDITVKKVLRSDMEGLSTVANVVVETIDTQQRFYFDPSRIGENNGGTVLNGWVQLPKVLKASWWKLPKSSGNCFAEISAMVAIAKPLGLKIEFDVAGLYDLGANYFPVRKSAISNGLEDYNGLTIECVEGVVFKTTATTGQDVFQLNSVKNFHILGYPKITASITSTAGAGSNGVSITNGGENLTIHVDAENLPYTVKSDYIDGGKAVSIQTGSTTNNPTRNIDIHLRNCVNVGYGFNADITTSQIQNNPITNIRARGFIENAYRGVSVALDQTGASIGAQGINIGIDIDFTTKNCQQHYTEQRAWNLNSKIYAINTLAASAIRKSDISYDTAVYVDSILGKKYGSAEINGSVLDVDVVHRIGGTGSNGGVTGASSYTDLLLKVNFQSAATPFDLINSGGNIINNSYIVLDNISTLPALLFNNLNTVLNNGAIKTKDLAVMNSFKVTDTAGVKKFGVRSDGHLEVPLTSGAVGTTSAGKMAVYNRDSGAFIGYVPIFTT